MEVGLNGGWRHGQWPYTEGLAARLRREGDVPVGTRRHASTSEMTARRGKKRRRLRLGTGRFDRASLLLVVIVVAMAAGRSLPVARRRGEAAARATL